MLLRPPLCWGNPLTNPHDHVLSCCSLVCPLPYTNDHDQHNKRSVFEKEKLATRRVEEMKSQKFEKFNENCSAVCCWYCFTLTSLDCIQPVKRVNKLYFAQRKNHRQAMQCRVDCFGHIQSLGSRWRQAK